MISTFYINEDWRKFQKDIVLIMIIEKVIEKKNYFHLFTKILIVVLPKFNFYSNWNLMYHGKRNREQEVKNLMVIRSAISVPYKNFRLFFFKYVWIYPLNSIQLDNFQQSHFHVTLRVSITRTLYDEWIRILDYSNSKFEVFLWKKSILLKFHTISWWRWINKPIGYRGEQLKWMFNEIWIKSCETFLINNRSMLPIVRGQTVSNKLANINKQTTQRRML